MVNTCDDEPVLMVIGVVVIFATLGLLLVMVTVVSAVALPESTARLAVVVVPPSVEAGESVTALSAGPLAAGGLTVSVADWYTPP